MTLGSRTLARFGYASQLAVAAILLAALPESGHAQSSTAGPGLTDERLVFANDVERAAAAANQSTFSSLDSTCNPGGLFDQIAAPEASQRPMGCSELAFFVYLTARELVHSANELLGEGPVVASLNVDQEGLGTALRWTAAEELAVQGSMATQFSGNQLSSLASRISALRFGSRGFSFANNMAPAEVFRPALVAERESGDRRGGGASADLEDEYSRWGGFVNGSFGWGTKQPTGNENAFDFDGSELTLGVDYRFPSNFVIGGMLGFTEQTVDFDEGASAISVVDGGVEADGTSAIVFGLYNGGQFFISGSLGLQSIDYDVERNINYPSFNPDVPASNSTALSSPEASIFTATVDTGYAFFAGRFTIEPYLNVDYLDISIDAFDEERSFQSLSGLIDDDAFNLRVAEQNFSSLDAALGLRIQATLSSNYGMYVPYVTYEVHREFEDESRLIRAGYAGTGNEGFAFAVPTDPLDDQYTTWSAGFSSVIRPGRQLTGDGPVTGGIMIFLQYQSIEDLRDYEDQVVSGGIRYEF